MICIKCKKQLLPEMECYIISAVIMKANEDYERESDVAVVCMDCYNL